jgi:hypothetical protein
MITGNPHIHTPYSNIGITHGNKSQLFIFTPRHRGSQVIRPFAYRFSDNIINKTAESIASGNDALFRQILLDPEISESLIPASNDTTHINMQYMSDNFTFVLVAHGMPRGRIIESYMPNTSCKTIYYGYFISPPYNTTFHGAAPTFDMQSMLVITHKTVINELPRSFGPVSASTRYDTVVDTNIVHPTTLRMMCDQSSGPMHVNSPDALFKFTDISSNGQHYTMLGEGTAIQNQQSPISIAGSLQVPTRNVSNVLRCIKAASEHVQAEASIGTLSPMSTQLFNLDGISDVLGHHLKGISGTSYHTALKEDTPITLGDIDRQYNPDTVIVSAPKSGQYCPTDQSIISVRNIYSSLILSVVPTVLSNAVLQAIAFSYDSRPTQFDQYGEFQIHAVSSAVDMTDYDLQKHTMACLHELKLGIFRHIRHSCGDFSVHVNGDCTASSQCVLNFYSDSYVMSEPFEVPTVFGGMVTPLIAGGMTTQQNAHALADVANILTGGFIDPYPPNMEFTTPNLYREDETYFDKF